MYGYRWGYVVSCVGLMRRFWMTLTVHLRLWIVNLLTASVGRLMWCINTTASVIKFVGALPTEGLLSMEWKISRAPHTRHTYDHNIHIILIGLTQPQMFKTMMLNDEWYVFAIFWPFWGQMQMTHKAVHNAIWLTHAHAYHGHTEHITTRTFGNEYPSIYDSSNQNRSCNEI